MTDAAGRPPASDRPLADRLAVRVIERLETILINQCARHGDGSLSLRWREAARPEGTKDAARLRLELDRLGEERRLSAAMRGSRAGPATCDLLCEGRGGSRRWFFCRLPPERVQWDGPVRGPRLRRLGRDLTRSLRLELQVQSRRPRGPRPPKPGARRP